MAYTPDPTNVAQPADSGVLASTAAAEFRSLKTYIAGLVISIAGKVTSGGALGTPSSGTLTSCSGLPVSGLTGLAAGIAAWLAAPSSANLRTALTDESGTGALLFQNGDLGTPSAGIGTNLTGTATGLTVGAANGLKSATTTVAVSAATAPSAGQVLQATGPAAAAWVTPSSGAAQGAAATTQPSVANTETSLCSYTTIAGELAVGTTFRIKVSCGTQTGSTAAIAAVKLRYGSTTLTGTIMHTQNSNNANNSVGTLDYEFTFTVTSVGAAGTAISRGMTSTGLALSPVYNDGSGATLDTTVASKLEVTFISGNAGNSHPIKTAVIHKIVA